MKQNVVIELKRPRSFLDDPLSQVLREGVQELLTYILKVESKKFLNQYSQMRCKDRTWKITTKR